MNVELSDGEWQQIMGILATRVTWQEANPLLMKIGEQLRAQQMQAHQQAEGPIDGSRATKQ